MNGFLLLLTSEGSIQTVSLLYIGLYVDLVHSDVLMKGQVKKAQTSP